MTRPYLKYTLDECNIISDGGKAGLSFAEIRQELVRAGFQPRSNNAIREKIRDLLGVKKPEQLFGEESRWRRNAEQGSAALLERLQKYHGCPATDQDVDDDVPLRRA